MHCEPALPTHNSQMMTGPLDAHTCGPALHTGKSKPASHAVTVPSAQTAWHWSIEDKLTVQSHTMAQRGTLAGELFLVRYGHSTISTQCRGALPLNHSPVLVSCSLGSSAFSGAPAPTVAPSSSDFSLARADSESRGPGENNLASADLSRISLVLPA